MIYLFCYLIALTSISWTALSSDSDGDGVHSCLELDFNRMLSLFYYWPCWGRVSDLYFSILLRNYSLIFLKAFIRIGCWILSNTILHFSREDGGGCISLLKGRYDYQYDFLISDYPFISGILVAFLNQNPLFFPPEETLILDICKKL